MIIYKRKLSLVFLILVSALGFLFLTSTFAQNSNKTSEGKVVVTIRNRSVFLPSSVNEAIDPADDRQFFTVFLRGNRSLHEMKYDEKLARSELSVPEGVYEIALRFLWGGTANYQRANIYVRAAKTESVFIEAGEADESTACDEKFGFVVLPSDSYDKNRKYPPIHFDDFVVNSPYKMVIKYCRKTVNKEKISYKDVFLTYKNVTIHVEKATLNGKTFSFRGWGNADGKVAVSTGNCIKKGKHVSINLSERKSKFACRDIRFY